MFLKKEVVFGKLQKKVLDDYEKKSPMTDGSKETNCFSDTFVDAENIYWGRPS